MPLPTPSKAYRRPTSILLSFNEPLAVEDIAADDHQVYVLATTQPDEYSMEPEHSVVLYGCLNGAEKSMFKLQGEGLADEHGVGHYVARPQRISIADGSHFLIVADRPPPAWNKPLYQPDLQAPDCLACEGRPPMATPIIPVPFALEAPQLALFGRHSNEKADFVHYLARPEPIVAEISECDISPSSVQLLHDHVAAVLRWRDPDDVASFLRGGGGQLDFMAGWQAAEACVWNWRSGEVVARIALPGLESSPPRLHLVGNARLVIQQQAFGLVTETIVYDLEHSKRLQTLTESAKIRGNRAHDALEVDSTSLKIPRLPFELAPSVGQLSQGTFIPPEEEKVWWSAKIQKSSFEQLPNNVEDLLLSRAETSIDALADGIITHCNGARAIVRVGATHPLRHGHRAHADFYVLDLAPSLEAHEDVYRVQCSRKLSPESRARSRDSGLLTPSDAASEESLQHGWRPISLRKIDEPWLVDALRRSKVIWTGGHLISFDANKAALQVDEF